MWYVTGVFGACKIYQRAAVPGPSTAESHGTFARCSLMGAAVCGPGKATLRARVLQLPALPERA